MPFVLIAAAAGLTGCYAQDINFIMFAGFLAVFGLVDWLITGGEW